jgi:hypothetical protein
MKDVLTTRELASRWSLSPKTLGNWRSQKRGPSYEKVGEWMVVYPLKDVLAYEKKFPFVLVRNRKLA